MNTTDSTKPQVSEKLITRMRNLFAMSQDVNSKHEAEIALRRCKSLMSQYGITEADLQTSKFGSDASYAAARLDTWRGYLAIGIAAFTNTIVTIKRCKNNNKVKRIVYSGFDADVQNAILISDYLEQALVRCVDAYKKESGNTSKAGATSFRNHFALALQFRMIEMSDEMEEESPETSDGTSLVVCKMKMVESEFGTQKIRKHTSRTSDRGAADAGRDAGEKINLNRQVTGKGNTKQIAA